MRPSGVGRCPALLPGVHRRGSQGPHSCMSRAPCPIRKPLPEGRLRQQLQTPGKHPRLVLLRRLPLASHRSLQQRALRTASPKRISHLNRRLRRSPPAPGSGQLALLPYGSGTDPQPVPPRRQSHPVPSPNHRGVLAAGRGATAQSGVRALVQGEGFRGGQGSPPVIMGKQWATRSHRGLRTSWLRR